MLVNSRVLNACEYKSFIGPCTRAPCVRVRINSSYQPKPLYLIVRLGSRSHWVTLVTPTRPNPPRHRFGPVTHRKNTALIPGVAVSSRAVRGTKIPKTIVFFFLRNKWSDRRRVCPLVRTTLRWRFFPLPEYYFVFLLLPPSPPKPTLSRATGRLQWWRQEGKIHTAPWGTICRWKAINSGVISTRLGLRIYTHAQTYIYTYKCIRRDRRRNRK